MQSVPSAAVDKNRTNGNGNYLFSSSFRLPMKTPIKLSMDNTITVHSDNMTVEKKAKVTNLFEDVWASLASC